MSSSDSPIVATIPSRLLDFQFASSNEPRWWDRNLASCHLPCSCKSRAHCYSTAWQAATNISRAPRLIFTKSCYYLRTASVIGNQGNSSNLVQDNMKWTRFSLGSGWTSVSWFPCPYVRLTIPPLDSQLSSASTTNAYLSLRNTIVSLSDISKEPSKNPTT